MQDNIQIFNIENLREIEIALEAQIGRLNKRLSFYEKNNVPEFSEAISKQVAQLTEKLERNKKLVKEISAQLRQLEYQELRKSC